MKRLSLLENNYNFERKLPNRWLVTMLWTFLCLIFLAVSLGVFILAAANTPINAPDKLYLTDFGILPYIIIFAGIPFIYYGLKLRMTSSFCDKKNENMTVRMTDDGVPVFTCREALKTWQIILVHTLPAVLAYFGLCAVILSVAFDAYCMILLFLAGFVIAYDLVLVICVLYIRARYNPDYISVNRHAYDITLYNK